MCNNLLVSSFHPALPPASLCTKAIHPGDFPWLGRKFTQSRYGSKTFKNHKKTQSMGQKYWTRLPNHIGASRESSGQWFHKIGPFSMKKCNKSFVWGRDYLILAHTQSKSSEGRKRPVGAKWFPSRRIEWASFVYICRMVVIYCQNVVQWVGYPSINQPVK